MTFLDRKTQWDRFESLPKPTQTTAVKHVRDVRNELERMGVDLNSTDMILNIDGTAAQWAFGYSPCLTAARLTMGGHWIMQYGRRMFLHESMKLQGIAPGRVRQPSSVSDGQLAHMVGNAMTVPVVGTVAWVLLDSIDWHPRRALKRSYSDVPREDEF